MTMEKTTTASKTKPTEVIKGSERCTCGVVVSGPFCSQCGRKTHVKPNQLRLLLLHCQQSRRAAVLHDQKTALGDDSKKHVRASNKLRQWELWIEALTEVLSDS